MHKICFLFLLLSTIMLLIPLTLYSSYFLHMGSGSVSIIFSVPEKIAVSSKYGGNFSDGLYIIVKNNNDFSIKVRVFYNVTPYCKNITLNVERNEITINPNASVLISLSLFISPGTIPGNYTLQIIVKVFHAGNILQGAIKRAFIIVVGGKVYEVYVKIRDSIGSPIDGYVRAYYIVNDEKVLWSCAYGHDIVFYATKGTFLIECFFAGKLWNSTLIDINDNITIEFIISYLRIENIKIEREVKREDDALVVSFDIVNENPYLLSKVVIISLIISRGFQDIYAENVSTLVISGATCLHITTAINPKKPWRSGEYNLSVEVIDIHGGILARKSITVRINLEKTAEVFPEPLKTILLMVIPIVFAMVLIKLRTRAYITCAYILSPAQTGLAKISPKGEIFTELSSEELNFTSLLGSQFVPIALVISSVDRRIDWIKSFPIYRLKNMQFAEIIKNAEYMIVVPYAVPRTLHEMYGKRGAIVVFGRGDLSTFSNMAYKFANYYAKKVSELLEKYGERVLLEPSILKKELSSSVSTEE